MDKIVISEKRYGRAANHYENDDFIDRLNSRYTVMILMLGIFIVSGKLYVGNPINCWTPAQFATTHNEYASSICWLKGSYYLPTDEITIPDRSKPRIYYVSFYQWTPFILLLMGLFFLMPRLLWHGLTKQSGIDIQVLVKTVKEHAEHKKSVDYAEQTISTFLNVRMAAGCLPCCGFNIRKARTILTIMYFTVKMIYIVNAIVQLVLLNSFLAFNFTSYGFTALGQMFTTTDWFESPRFPRVTMCDFMIRHLGSNQHWYAVQCNLPINIYNEKIFFGIWVWLLILIIANIMSTIVWLFSLLKSRRTVTIKRYLNAAAAYPPDDREQSTWKSEEHSPIDQFTKYIGHDGYLVVQILAHNTNDIITGKIVHKLYGKYREQARESNESGVSSDHIRLTSDYV